MADIIKNYREEQRRIQQPKGHAAPVAEQYDAEQYRQDVADGHIRWVNEPPVAEHTATPWETNFFGVVSIQTAKEITGKSGHRYKAAVAYLDNGSCHGTTEERKVNAEFICKAANAYDRDQQTIRELTEQCELFERTILYEIRKSKDKEGARMKTITLNLLREVLDRAKKGGE